MFVLEIQNLHYRQNILKSKLYNFFLNKINFNHKNIKIFLIG
jgi:hypothetical protein